MNYRIIKDEQLLMDFIDWLPDLTPDEIYYLSLFGRKKYCPELKYSKTDKTQLKRFTSDKERMLQKIKQLETQMGSYYLKDTPALQESLALYVTVNPRSQVIATRNLLIKLAQLVGQPYNGHNVHQIAMSEIQKAKSDTIWVDFDLDVEKSDSYLDRIKTVLHELGVVDFKILETRGGYHILVKPNAVMNKMWYKGIVDNFPCDVVGDNMIPVVGCTQGNFTPRFIE